jgi:hypothetical protein
MSISALKEWFKTGINKVSWYISLVSKRFHVELAVMKLMSEVEALKKKRQEELAELGERVLHIKKTSEVDPFAGYEEIEGAYKRVLEIEQKIEELKSKAKEISSLEE